MTIRGGNSRSPPVGVSPDGVREPCGGEAADAGSGGRLFASALPESDDNKYAVQNSRVLEQRDGDKGDGEDGGIVDHDHDSDPVVGCK